MGWSQLHACVARVVLQGFEFTARARVRNLYTVVCACNSSLTEVQTGGSQGLIGQAESASSKERSSL